MIDPHTVLSAIWTGLGHDPAALGRVELTGAEPVLPSSFAVGTAMQASVAASALAAAEVWRTRTGKAQRVGVDMRAAAIAARSERYLQIDGKPAPELWDKIAGAYPCGDGRYVRLHTNFPHHRDGVLKLLDCAYDKTAVAEALKDWKAFDFEDAEAKAGLVVAAMRTFDEWDGHPQGQAIAALPLMSVERIGDAAPLAGFVGRFHALKDVPAFMESAAIAIADNPQLHFVMVGDGLARDNAALTPLFAALPPQRFHALGPRDDIEAILPAMDFFCLSSISEAFPNVVGEAMASGLPCIATDVGDCARLIDGHGRIVPRGDPAAMAAAISDLARMDVARRAEIGKAARARIEAGYSLRATVDAYTQLYDSMMKRDV